MKRFQVASFFTGIGGFDLAFEQAGFKVNFQCEINGFCQNVLRKHWPAIPLLEDIGAVEPDMIPCTDVWCGGFPCQDLSVARGGRGRHGLNGTRSGLFFKLAQLVRAKKPRVVLIENVHGLFNSNGGRDFAELLHAFDHLGYAVSWRLFNSRYFGVPQSRPRIYICALLRNPFAVGNILFESDQPMLQADERSAFLEPAGDIKTGPVVPKVAFCLAATSGRHTGTDWSRTYVSYNGAVRRLTPMECERLQGFPDNWTLIEAANADAEKTDSLRYHALGNAVSVPIVKWIALRIRKQFDQQHRRVYLQNKWEFLNEARSRWKGLAGPKTLIGDLGTIRRSHANSYWPSAGILWRGTFISRNIAPAPCAQAHSNLVDIIEVDRPRARYFLSANAAEGILRRVDHQGRKLFPPLRATLERLSGRRVEHSEKNKSTEPSNFALAQA